MMYLTEPKLFDIVKKQLLFKFQTHHKAFATLLVLQVFAIFFGSAEHIYPSRMNELTGITWITLSNENSLSLTLFWTIVMGVLISSSRRRNESFTFVTNNIAHHLSNFVLMLTVAFLGGLAVVLSGSVIKMFGYLRYSVKVIESPGLLLAPSDFFIRVITVFAYMLLFFLISYTITSFIQRSKKTILLFVFGWIMLSSVTSFWNGPTVFSMMTGFFFDESNLIVFLIKVSLTSLALFFASIAVTNRLEVRNI
jgi:hypothetical protein